MSSYITDELKRRILEEVWPGTPIQLDKGVVVTCPLQRLGCQHNNGDRSPSFSLNTGGGSYRCKRSGRHGATWKHLVLEVLGEARWKELTGGNRASAGKLEDRWERLDPEELWTRTYGITAQASRAYLRRGKWTPQDDTSDSVIGLWAGGKLRGIKWRAPREGYTWRAGSAGLSKYVWTAGSKPKGFLFLGELAAVKTQDVPVVVCAGEKDALVALSHLDPGAWSPVTGVDGEATPPVRALQELCQGRRVVIAYDPDQAGREGAWQVARLLRGAAADVRVAVLPEGPAGEGEPKWDVAALVRYRGAAALVEALERAIPCPEAWRPAHVKDEPAIAPEASAAAGEGGDGGEGHRIRDPLDAWRVVNGQIVEARRDREGHERLDLRFAGNLRTLRTESVRVEDPSETGGWAKEHRVTYLAELGGNRIERTVDGGRTAFNKLVDQELAGADRCSSITQRAFLYQFVSRSPGERRSSVRAIGHHDTLGGWVAAPGLVIGKGAIAKSEWAVDPPGELQEFRRYRLLELSKDELRRVGAWVVSDFARCDHADQAYTLPIIGTLLAAPLWPYVRTLTGWQRYALFVKGLSGTGKTTLIRTLMCLWGSFSDSEDMTTWVSSGTHIEDLLHLVVAAPVLVGDYKRAQMTQEQRKVAVSMIQSYADRVSKGRGMPTGRAMRKRPPRCQLLVEGEDLPEGQDSTLGRLLIVPVESHDEHERCATTENLDPEMLALLPGITAAWIAWVQREHEKLGRHIQAVRRQLDQDLAGAPKTANRSRILRNYAIQVAAIGAFARWLEDEVGVVGAYEGLQPRSAEVHLDLALRQLGRVGAESAASMFLATLRQLLHAEVVHLKPRKGADSGTNPFPTKSSSPSLCVGVYHLDEVVLWPDIAVGQVQAHLTKGGGDRIDFSRATIGDQLEQMGAIQRGDRARPGNGAEAVRVWITTTEWVGAERTRQVWDAGDPS